MPEKSKASTSRKSLPKACALIELHLRQNARRCQPKRRTSDRGSALNVPTKHGVEHDALPAAVEARLDRKPLFDDLDVAEPPSSARNSAGAVLAAAPARPRARAAPSSASTARSATRRGCRPGTSPSCPGFSTRRHSRHQPPVVGGVLHDAMRVDEIERVVGKRQPLAVGFAQVRLEALLREILTRQRDRRRRQVDAGDDRAAAWRSGRDRCPRRNRPRAPACPR